MKTIKNLIYVLLGCALWIFFVLFNFSMYKGTRRFYGLLVSEKNTLWTKIAKGFVGGYLARVFIDYDYYLSNKDSERVTPGLIAAYSDESLKGYGEENYEERYGGATLQEQQRGLALPLVESWIEEAKDAKSVIEIGTANGDVIAYLAEKYPEIRGIGVDFFVKNAAEKYKNIKNLEFVKGYALELLESQTLKGDLVIGSSILGHMNPKELAMYFKLFYANDIGTVIINEPSWGGYVHENNDKVISRHMESRFWFHNYCGYLRQAGYAVKDFKFFPYKHPKSTRPDIYISLVRAEKTGSDKVNLQEREEQKKITV